MCVSAFRRESVRYVPSQSWVASAVARSTIAIELDPNTTVSVASSSTRAPVP